MSSKTKWGSLGIPSAQSADLVRIISRLEEISGRELAIVGHGLVEGALSEAIHERVEPDYDSRLFKPGGLLHSYSAQHKVAHALGIIPKTLRDELDTIGSIRNAFAHSVAEFNFSDTKLTEHIYKLSAAKHWKEWIKFYSSVASVEAPAVGPFAFCVVDAVGHLVMGISKDELETDEPMKIYRSSIKLTFYSLMLASHWK